MSDSVHRRTATSTTSRPTARACSSPGTSWRSGARSRRARPVDGGAFVTKLDRTGSSLVFSAVLGGDDRANHGKTGLGVAVDPAGATYVAGVTNAAAFPTTSHVLQPRVGGGGDAFVTNVDAAGRSVAYSTYLGGSGDDSAHAIAAAPAATRTSWARRARATCRCEARRSRPTRAARTRSSPSSGHAAARSPTRPTSAARRGDDGATAIALGAHGEAYVTGPLGSGALAGSRAGSKDPPPPSARGRPSRARLRPPPQL